MILERMHKDTSIPVILLTKIVDSADHRYKTFEIKKRNSNQKRKIDHPSKPLKLIQRWIVRNILSRYPVHVTACAYIKGKSILDNAEPHKASRYILKLDFKDFFHSINRNEIEKYFTSNSRLDLLGLTINDINILSKAITMKGGLTIGAPSSPMMSNLIMFDFDKFCEELCLNEACKYTRYADDIFISTNLPNKLSSIFVKIKGFLAVQYPYLSLNEKKTKFASKKGRRNVTGLILTTQDGISIGREYKRLIRSKVDRYIKGKLEYDEILNLAGHLAYINSVEPEFIQKIRVKYTCDVVAAIMKKNRNK